MRLQLEGLLNELTSPQGSSVLQRGTAPSLEQCCEVLRHSVGCDVIDAVEDALVNLCMRGPVHQGEHPDINFTHCSNALNFDSYTSERGVDLWMMKSEFETAICTRRWQEQIRLASAYYPNDQITGADAANFTKVMYKCYSIIVQDLWDKGFTLVMSNSRFHSGHNRRLGYDMSIQIFIRPHQHTWPEMFHRVARGSATAVVMPPVVRRPMAEVLLKLWLCTVPSSQ